MPRLCKATSLRERGAALLIVLALVVLVAGLIVAYFSRATSDRPVAQGSFNQSKADQLAASATDNIVGDLRQEIIIGSASPAPTFGPSTSPGPYYLYVPTNSAYMIPQRSGTLLAAPNLIRRSVSPDNIAAPGLRSFASAVNSAPVDPANPKRGDITKARWNRHYLLPKANTSDDGTEPIAGFTAPDWVFVSSDPANTTAGRRIIGSPDPLVIGRYAYAVYDLGGLVDVNVAGYPTGTSIFQYGRKGSLAFADLTAPSPYPIPNPDTGPNAVYQVDRLVGWRNYATTQPTNQFPDVGPPANRAFAYNFRSDATPAANFYNYVINNSNGFMNTSATTWSVNSNALRTDQNFVQRQELIAFRNTSSEGLSINQKFSSNTLQYLSTFSREGVVQPSATFYGAGAGTPQWSPATPTSTNPNFQKLFVTQSFIRNDGTIANVGDYLVNERFLLQRLNWLTYKGPSALRTIPTSAPALGDANYDMWLLTRASGISFGLTSTFLQQGTDLGQLGQSSSSANIYKYFGLVWDSINERWNYIGHPGSPSATSPLATSIATFGIGGTQAATREPDFFELLQAGIISGSLGDPPVYSDPGLPSVHQLSKMLHILTIGANLIAQSRADSYPVRIACSVDIGGGNYRTMEAVGAPRLPYLNSLAACPVAGTSTTGAATGGVNWLLVPNLWDPFRDSWDLTEANASNPNLTPGYLRPQVRITVSGSVGLGTVLAGPAIRTGIVSSALVTPSPSPTAVVTISPAQSLALTTPTASPGMGRNGFLEAARMSTSDVSPTPSPFTTTTSVSPTPVGQWVNVPYPSPTGTPTPAGNNVVFRVSFPGTSIPAGWTSPAQNPVLVLKPGFQMTVDYQSPNGTWYSYSFLQGNNEPSTWISGSNTSSPGLNLTTTESVYGRNPSPAPTPVTTPYPTILLTSPSPTVAPATVWNVTALAEAPMFAKADPRSIRYNSQVGVVRITSPTPTASPFAAGVIRSIWPNGYPTPPPMTIGSTPTVTPTPTPTGTPTPTVTPNAPNPATLGDNAIAGNQANPYAEPPSAAATPNPWRPVMLNRPFRSVGEMAYAFRDQPFRTLSFSWAPASPNPDAGLLDLFTVNDSSDARNPRAGVINLNSAGPWTLAAIVANTVQKEDTPRAGSPGSPTPVPLSSPAANTLAANLASLISPAPVKNKADLANIIANVPDTTGLGPSTPKTQRESIARGLGEVDQTRTWNLLVDVVAQSGHYKPNAANLQNDFIVEGEQHYWVHVAIDRFTGQVLDKQIEVVNE